MSRSSSRRRVHWLHLLLGLATCVAAFYGWRLSLAPPPSQLLQVSGLITSSEEVRVNRRRALQFQIAGAPIQFVYPRTARDYDAAKVLLVPGHQASVGYVVSGSPQVWELSVDGQPIVSISDVHDAQLENGRWALAVLVACGLCTLFLGGIYWRQRR